MLQPRIQSAAKCVLRSIHDVASTDCIVVPGLHAGLLNFPPPVAKNARLRVGGLDKNAYRSCSKRVVVCSARTSTLTKITTSSFDNDRAIQRTDLEHCCCRARRVSRSLSRSRVPQSTTHPGQYEHSRACTSSGAPQHPGSRRMLRHTFGK